MAPSKVYSVTASPTSISSDTITLGEYIFLRISQANPKLKSIFGIPGDFNLNLLENLYSDTITSKGIKFIGLCNELNAAYTADGYARTIGGLSVLITTYGVGELSAINGIAGAFAEYSPVLHIVGTTSTKQQNRTSSDYIYNHHHLVQSKDPLQHPNHDVYKSMVKDISCASESLTNNIETNLLKIDRVLTKIIQDARPGYLFIPSDVSDIEIDIDHLPTPLLTNQLRDVFSLNHFTDLILSKLYKSKNTSILVDTLLNRFNFQNELDQFVEKLPQSVKLFSTNMGRHVDETLPNFVGCYYGISTTDHRIKDELESSDLLINLGYFNGETNTSGYTNDFSKVKDYVEIHPDYILIDGKHHYINSSKSRLFSMGDLVNNITEKLISSYFQHTLPAINYKYQSRTHYTPSKIDKVHIPQTKLIDWLNGYLQPNDLLVIETCSFQFAIPDLVLPKGVDIISQNFYGSIGFALPATLGATLASNDLGSKRRIILIEGDGSCQMTIQEISTFLKYHDYCKVMPKIFIINNDGYTVERLIKGPTRPYNDILGTWDWSNLLKTFGDPNELIHKGIKLRNVEEFDSYFDNEIEDSRLQVFDLITGKFDVPDRFIDLFCKERV